jgi:hypothetical protein
MAVFDLNTIKSWFVKNARPTAQQFSDTWDSFWHKNDKLPVSDINAAQVQIVVEYYPNDDTAQTVKETFNVLTVPYGYGYGKSDLIGVI